MPYKSTLLLKLSLLLLLPLSLICNAQNTKAEVDSNYNNPDYFHDYQKEKFFLHTNKNLYFSGEKLWWQAYVTDDVNEKAITETVNLHIALYNTHKNLILQDLYFCNNGLAFGDIELPKDLESGTYFVTLNTQWNKNFKSNYVKTIQVSNLNSKPAENQEAITKNDSIHPPKIDFRPESGLILNGLKNTINYAVNTNNLEIPHSIPVDIIDNTSGQIIAKSETNYLGLGSVSFVFQPQHSYTAQLNYKGKHFKFDLPKANNSGLVIQKNNKTEKGDLDFTIRMSKDFIAKHNKETLYAIIHRNNTVRSVLPFTINKSYTKYVIPLASNNLFNGVNSLTVFNSTNQPIAERHFYTKTKKDIELEVTPKSMEGDSVNIAIKLLKNIIPTQFSISVLPEENKLNEKTTNISTALLLQPYLKQLPDKELDSLSTETLDIITQMYSYSTPLNPFKNSKPLYAAEMGIKVTGRVNAKLTTGQVYKVMLTSNKNNILEVSQLKNDQTFEFSNLVMLKGSNYSLALIDSAGSIQKASFFVFNTHYDYKPDTHLNYTENKIIHTSIFNNANSKSYTSTQPLFLKDAEQLDVIELSGKKKKTENDDLTPDLPNNLGKEFTKKLPITQFDKNLEIIDYLNRNVRRNRIDQMLLIFDGAPQPDFKIIEKMFMPEIESININYSGAGYGIRGSGGVIFINTKKDGDFADSIGPRNHQENTIDLGFKASSLNFTPYNIQFPNFQAQKTYETLDWKPNITLLPNRELPLKVNKGDHQHIQLIINGLNEEGQLIYKKIHLNFTEGL